MVSKSTLTEDQCHQVARFLLKGIEYYIAGRTAAFSVLWNVSGNILHHSVECLLKAQLVQGAETIERLWKHYRHNLMLLWDAFKKDIAARGRKVALDQHDEAIKLLHRFEDIRYPEEKTNYYGVVINTVGLRPRQKLEGDSYHVILQEIDSLVADILGAIRVDVDKACGMLPEDARAFFNRDNNAIQIPATRPTVEG